MSHVLNKLKARTIDIADARAELAQAAGVKLDHLEVVDPTTLEPLNDLSQPALAVAAIYVGPVRLIDNIDITNQ